MQYKKIIENTLFLKKSVLRDPNASKLSKGPSGPLLFVKYEPCELSWPVSASG